jgi:hypothetical protein
VHDKCIFLGEFFSSFFGAAVNVTADNVAHRDMVFTEWGPVANLSVGELLAAEELLAVEHVLHDAAGGRHAVARPGEKKIQFVFFFLFRASGF